MGRVLVFLNRGRQGEGRFLRALPMAPGVRCAHSENTSFYVSIHTSFFRIEKIFGTFQAEAQGAEWSG